MISANAERTGGRLVYWLKGFLKMFQDDKHMSSYDKHLSIIYLSIRRDGRGVWVCERERERAKNAWFLDQQQWLYSWVSNGAVFGMSHPIFSQKSIHAPLGISYLCPNSLPLSLLPTHTFWYTQMHIDTHTHTLSPPLPTHRHWASPSGQHSLLSPLTWALALKEKPPGLCR